MWPAGTLHTDFSSEEPTISQRNGESFEHMHTFHLLCCQWATIAKVLFSPLGCKKNNTRHAAAAWQSDTFNEHTTLRNISPNLITASLAQGDTLTRDAELRWKQFCNLYNYIENIFNDLLYLSSAFRQVVYGQGQGLTLMGREFVNQTNIKKHCERFHDSRIFFLIPYAMCCMTSSRGQIILL